MYKQDSYDRPTSYIMGYAPVTRNNSIIYNREGQIKLFNFGGDKCMVIMEVYCTFFN